MEFNEKEIKKILVEIVNRVHPFYQKIRPYVDIYDKNKCRNLEFDKVRLEVNYDFFGYIENQNGKLIAKGSVMGVGYIGEFDTINDAIEFLVKQYFKQ